MSEEQIRLACMEMALIGMSNNPRGSPSQRASVLVAWVGDSEARLDCLRLTVKQYGSRARIGVDRLLEEATRIFDFVAPPVAAKPTRKKVRPKKN